MYTNSLKYFLMKFINWERKGNFNISSSAYGNSNSLYISHIKLKIVT